MPPYQQSLAQLGAPYLSDVFIPDCPLQLSDSGTLSQTVTHPCYPFSNPVYCSFYVVLLYLLAPVCMLYHLCSYIL